MKHLLLLLSLISLSLCASASAGIIVIGNLARTANIQPGGAFDLLLRVRLYRARRDVGEQ